MINPNLSRSWLCAAWILTVVPLCVYGAPPRAALPAEQGADSVSLKGGGKLSGALFERTPEGNYRLAVRREWLKTAQPKLFAQESTTELERLRECYRVLETRIADWKRDRADDARLLGYLDDEADRVAKIRKQLDQPNPPLPEFMLIDVPAAKIERIQTAAPDRKQLVLLAWLEHLANPETRSVSDLKRELESKNVALEQPVDLFDRLAPGLQTDAEWTQRQAIVEYLYRKPLDFQGMGDALFATSGGAKAPRSEELIVAVLNQQLNSQLADLLGTPGAPAPAADWTEKPARTAAAEDVNGFHVTRLKLDALNKRGEIEGRFLARSAEGRWETVWRTTLPIDSAKARPDLEKRIANDPQVKKALSLLQLAGIDAQGDQFQSAMRLGAGVMDAQQACDSQFFGFRDRYTEHLDGPPLPRVAGR